MEMLLYNCYTHQLHVLDVYEVAVVWMNPDYFLFCVTLSCFERTGHFLQMLASFLEAETRKHEASIRTEFWFDTERLLQL